MTYGCKSRLAKAVAGGPGPSLAGATVTWGPKRRQEPCGVRENSLESLKIAEAELLPDDEGSMWAVVTRDGLAPPGSKTASRMESHLRNPGGPAGTIGEVTRWG